MNMITIADHHGHLVVDSRLIAEELEIQHKNFLETLTKHLEIIQDAFGPVAFETRRVIRTNGSYQERWALLTENQLRFVLARCRVGLSAEAIAQFASFGWDLSAFASRPLKRTKRRESDYSNDLSKQLGGKREVVTLAGNIDVLTPTEVIEVKPVKEWKAALGQVLVYGSYYPSHQKRIHLFGETQESFLALIESHCSKFNVRMTWEA